MIIEVRVLSHERWDVDFLGQKTALRHEMPCYRTGLFMIFLLSVVFVMILCTYLVLFLCIDRTRVVYAAMLNMISSFKNEYYLKLFFGFRPFWLLKIIPVSSWRRLLRTFPFCLESNASMRITVSSCRCTMPVGAFNEVPARARASMKLHGG